jgi:hypothetical protein
MAHPDIRVRNFFCGKKFMPFSDILCFFKLLSLIYEVSLQRLYLCAISRMDMPEV